MTTSTISMLSQELDDVVNLLGDSWAEHSIVILDTLHYWLDRQLPYVLSGHRRGTPRIAFVSGRSEANLINRLIDLDQVSPTDAQRIIENMVELLDEMVGHFQYIEIPRAANTNREQFIEAYLAGEALPLAA